MGNLKVVVTTKIQHSLRDREGVSGSIGQSTIDSAFRFFGPAPEFDFIFPCPGDINQPITTLLNTAENLPLLIDKNIKPFGGR